MKVHTDTVNDAIKYFKSKSIIEANDFIKVESDWVLEVIRLKKRDYKEAKLGDNRELMEIRRERKWELGFKNKKKIKKLFDNYRKVDYRKALKTLIKELKQTFQRRKQK